MALWRLFPIKALKRALGFSTEREPATTGPGAEASSLGPGPWDRDPYYAWYRKQMRLATKRAERYNEYDEMDKEDLVVQVLDLYAGDSTQVDLRTGKVIWVESKNEEIQKICNERLEEWGVEEIINPLARAIAKYGDDFEGLIQEKLSDGRAGPVLGLRYFDPRIVHVLLDKYGRVKGFYVGKDPSDADEGSIYEPWTFIHFKRQGRGREDPYGSSVLEASRRSYRRLMMMEQALVIYRVKRSPQRLVFYIDVGEMSPTDAYSFVNDVRRDMKKRMLVDPVTGQVRQEVDPWTIDEDIYFPIRPGSASKVDAIQGTDKIGPVLDIDYMRKKFLGGVSIPPDYIGFSDAKGGLLAQSPLAYQDIQFARTCRSIQKGLTQGFARLLQIDLHLRGIDSTLSENEFVVRMAPISHLEELQLAEALQAKVAVLDRLAKIGEYFDVEKKKWMEFAARISGFPLDLLSCLDSDTAAEVGVQGEVPLSEAEKEALRKVLQDPSVQEKIDKLCGSATSSRKLPKAGLPPCS